MLLKQTKKQIYTTRFHYELGLFYINDCRIFAWHCSRNVYHVPNGSKKIMREVLIFLHSIDLLIPAIIIVCVLFSLIIHILVFWRNLFTPVIDLPKDSLKP